MSEIIQVLPVNESYVRIRAEASTLREIAQLYTYTVPGYKFTKQHKFFGWDGTKQLFSEFKPLLPKGLLPSLYTFALKRDYEIRIEIGAGFGQTAPSEEEVTEWADDLMKDHPTIKPRKDQIEALRIAIMTERHLFLSPTSSGKSLIIYMIHTWFQQEGSGKRTLLLVPTKNLVRQMAGDVLEYGGLVAGQLMGGIDPNTVSNSEFVVSTWQTVANLGDEFMSQFDTLIVDEAHQAAANVLTGLVYSATGIKRKFGLTGTLDGSRIHEMVLTGMFGPVTQVSTTRQRIDAGDAAEPYIHCIGLRYSKEDCDKITKFTKDPIKKRWRPATYQEEVDFMIAHEGRRRFIANLALSLKGNTLIMFNRNEDYGIPLHDLMTSMAPDRDIRLVYGATEVDEREKVRTDMKQSGDIIALASIGVFSTGLNIPSIKNIIFAYPMKKRIKVLQSIGRGLRLDDGKDRCDIFDIVDDLRGKSRQNFLWKHFLERAKEYDVSEFERDWSNFSLAALNTMSVLDQS